MFAGSIPIMANRIAPTRIDALEIASGAHSKPFNPETGLGVAALVHWSDP